MRSGNSDRWPAAKVLVGCTVGNLVSSKPVIYATFGTFLKPVSASLGWSRAEFSVVILIVSTIGVLGYPLAGRAADSLGFRKVALAGAILFGLSVAALCLIKPNHVLVYGLYGIIGITATLSSSALLSKPITQWFSRNKGLLFALTSCGVNAGFVLMPVIAALLLSEFGWRTAYLGLGLTVLVLGLPALLMIADPPTAEADKATPLVPEPASDGMTAAEARRSPAFWILLVSIGLGAGAISAVNTHIVPILTDRHFSLAAATGVTSMVALAGAIAIVLVSAVLDRTGVIRIAGFFLSLAIVGIGLLALAHQQSLIVAGGALIGIGNGTEYGLLPFAVSYYFGKKSFSELYGTILGISVLAAGLAPVLMDLAFGKTGNYYLALVALGFVVAFCAVLTLCLPSVAVRRRSSALRLNTLSEPAL